MPRLKADIRISVKVHGKRCRKLELVRQPVGARYWVRIDGKRSEKLPEATATEVADRIRRWIALR